MNINKADLVNTLAQKNRAYKKYMVKDIVDDIFDEIANALRNGDRVSIYGFDVKKYKSHPALHPVTKESIVVPEFQNVVFKSGAELLRSIRE